MNLQTWQQEIVQGMQPALPDFGRPSILLVSLVNPAKGGFGVIMCDSMFKTDVEVRGFSTKRSNKKQSCQCIMYSSY